MEEALSDFIKNALNQPQPKNKRFILGPVSPEIVKQLANESGLNLTDYIFTIDVYAVKHIIKSHGNVQKEEACGQKAITVEDFNLIYQIVTEPDIVF